MENKQEQKEPKKFGRILNGLVLRKYVGSGDVTIDGVTVKFALSHGMSDGTPIVTLGDKHFVLDWDDIVELAEQAGLFGKAVTK